MPLLPSFVSRTLEHRDYTLDALRGLAMVGMILVNGAPPTDSIYAPLVHAPWHGWTLADTIFPLFLFVVGVSIVLASKRSGDDVGAPADQIYWRIARRTVLLFAIGVALVNFPYYELHKLTLTGILAHIALCYLVVALLYLHTTWRAQLVLIVIIWLVHWGLLSLLDVPDFGAGVLTQEGNASKYVDLMLLGPHSQSAQIETDPDGVLVMFSSITTTMIGVLTGVWLQNRRDMPTKVTGIFSVGFVLFVLGNVWDVVLPINKQLWTGSFVALTAGISLQVFALGYSIIEIGGFKSWAKPLQIAGVNALAFFIFAGFIQRILVYGRIDGAGGIPVRLRYFIYEQLFASWPSGKLAALVYASAYLVICYGFIVLLYRKKLFIRL